MGRRVALVGVGGTSIAEAALESGHGIGQASARLRTFSLVRRRYVKESAGGVTQQSDR
jgi:hypothetical protein